jgi:hypothetical protein
MKTTGLLIISFILLLVSNSSAQDTTKAEKGWKWEWEWDEFEEWTEGQKKQPTIFFNYGFSNISRKDVEASFADNNLLELKLGYTYHKTTRYAEYIEKYKFNYLFLNKNSTNLAGGKESSPDIGTTNWQFGTGWSGGYGYKIGDNAAIVPYFTSSMNWTNIDFTDDSLNPNDERIKDLYDETFRFGTSSEAGIRVQPASLIVLEAGYERSIVFERHLFWKWAGSGIIEIAAHGLLDVFIKEIFKSSPAAGPIVFFVLKSALGYGLYELRQEKMNWPFSSAPPIAFDNIKFGLTFVF